MPSQLEVYKRALDLMGARHIVSLSQNTYARHEMDAAWSFVVAFCLEQGIWGFALRTDAAIAATLPTPNYGFTNAYTKPADAIHTYFLLESANGITPLPDYVEDAGLYLTRTSSLYVRYTSNGTSYGNNLNLWPWSFAKYVASELAAAVCYTLTRSGELENKIEQQARMRLIEARAMEAVQGAPGLLSHNALVRREFKVGGNILEPFAFPVVQPSQEGGQGASQ